MESANEHTILEDENSTSFQDLNGTSGNLNGTVQNIDGVDSLFLESNIYDTPEEFDFSSNTGFDGGHGDIKL